MSRHIRRGKGSFPVDLLKNDAAFTALFKNTRTLKFKGQLTFAFFAAVNHLSGPLRKQFVIGIGGFRLASVQTPLPSGKIWEGAPSPIFPEGRGFCPLAKFQSVLCVWTLEFACFDRGRHIRNPRGRLGTRLLVFVTSAKRSKLTQKFCHHGNVASHFFFLNSAMNPHRSAPVFPKFAPVGVQ